MDIYSMSEEELTKIWRENPELLKKHINQNNYNIYKLAKLFIEHPSLGRVILESIDDPNKLHSLIKEQLDQLYDERDESWVNEEINYINALDRIEEYSLLKTKKSTLETRRDELFDLKEKEKKYNTILENQNRKQGEQK